MRRIYFDHNSTSPMICDIKKTINSFPLKPYNPSSQHIEGVLSRKILNNARSFINKLLLVYKSHFLIFTSSCTESNNIVIKNLKNKLILCSMIEHKSIINSIKNIQIKINFNGIINIHELRKYISNNINILFAINYANNELGTIQPIKTIILISYNKILILCDITQALGKLFIDIKNIDFITFNSHKLGGPLGIGTILYSKNSFINPIMYGGKQEYGIRPGTQNIISIQSMKIALKKKHKLEKKYKKIKTLKNYLEYKIINIVKKNVIYSFYLPRLPNTSSIYMPNVNSITQLIYFDINGIALSTGSACSSIINKFNTIHISMGLSTKVSTNFIRISLGYNTIKNDIKIFIKHWNTLYKSVNTN